MPHIALHPDLYGITSLLDFRPEIAAPLCRLTQLLLRGESTMTEAEREMIAAHVSSLNACTFCSSAHTAATCLLPGGKESGIEPMQTDLQALHISDKMKGLLSIATKVQKNGNQVTQHDIDVARASGATDLEIHDTVLIASLFCLYNRYVDGLATLTPSDPEFYTTLGKRITTRGYLMPEDGYDATNYKPNII
ncbi:MAG: carboxymuconolactone decarboxylase family protein [Saprospiraceae bacterium]|nr:carboxymuconolactone decarboxylase family protein [Saprospiraceae bacterium]